MRRSTVLTRLAVVLLFAVSSASALAQEELRVTSSPSAVAIRVEVVSAGGTILYDSDWHAGNVLDWNGAGLPYGTHTLRVLSKDLEGRVAEKQTDLHVSADRIAIDPATSDLKLTTTAHDGTNGALVTTSGDLSFRFGDFLNRKDSEAMRLSPEGNLDVKGWIRPGQGIIFPDGSAVTSAGSIMRMRASRPAEESADAKLHPKSDVSGTGTTNQVTKWLDTMGTLGNSTINEMGGAVRIGTIAAQGQLQIAGAANQDIFSGMGPNLNGPAFNFGYGGQSFGVGAGFLNARPAAAAVAPNPSLRFMTVNQERMIVTNAGNVGIGTSTPGQKLDVIGGGIRSNAAIDAGTQFNIAGQRMLSVPGTGNLFIGPGAGASLTTGADLVFVGPNAGFANTSGFGNTFVGYQSGQNTVDGLNNSFFGRLAGASNTTGSGNAFFGNMAGNANTGNANNSYFGANAGQNDTGLANSYFGSSAGAGQAGASGQSNSFFGVLAGSNISTGYDNQFFGEAAGSQNTSGFGNAFIGVAAGLDNTTGFYNIYIGDRTGHEGTTASNNTYVGHGAGFNTTTGSSNTLLGSGTGASLTTETYNTFIGAGANGAASITNATALGANASVTQSDSVVLGGSNARVGIGTTAPKETLHVAGSGNVYVSTPGNGVILKSPDGLTCKNLTIDDTGAIALVAITCP
jgi:hypothetical protein